MNKLLSLLFITLLLFIYKSTLAQTKIIIHENTTQHDDKSKSSPGNNPNNYFSSEESAIKLNMTSVFRGDFSLSYERKLEKDFSIEAGLGVTYGDFIFDEGNFFNFSPDNMVNSRRSYSAGPSVKVGTRWYPNSQDEGISGGYLCMELGYRKYNSEVSQTTGFTKFTESNVHKDVRASFGWQDTGWNDYLFYDISIGAGYRLHDRRYLGYYDPNNYTDQRLISASKNYPFFFITIKAGIPLGS